jgi:membrane fusion protein, multidrug efflux system
MKNITSSSAKVAFSIWAIALPLMPVSAQQPPPALPVTVAAPLAKRITQWDEFSGRFEAVESVEVRPRVSGFIDAVHFKDGQLVKAGELLFTIDKRPFQIALESAQAEIARTTAQVDLAENEVERAAPLAKTRVLTEREFDKRKADLSVAKAGQLTAMAVMKTAELNLEWAEVKAPIAGRISNRKIDVGNVVSSGQNGAPTLLTTIVSLDPIHFTFDVSEADFLRYARLFKAGQRQTSRDTTNPVRVRLADETEWTRMGAMDFVDNQLNARSGTLRGRAIFANKDELLTPGLFARMQLFAGEFDAMLVPDTAVISDQARKIVFAVGPDNVIKPVPVTLGTLVDGLRVVTSGLSSNDRIVIDGLANPAVRPGSKVVPQDGVIKAVAAN